MAWLVQYLPGFLLFFCRITAFFVIAPVFSGRNVPGSFKVGLAFIVSFLSFSVFGTSMPVSFDDMYVLYIIREVLVGIALGFIAYMFFTIVQIAGGFIDMQMGFGIANVIDPMTGLQSPVIGNLKYMFAMLLFLAFNGHHYLLRAIMQSYEWVPLTNELFQLMYGGRLSEFMVHTFSHVFALSFQLAAPMVVALFLTDVGLGLLARVAPQFNVFVIGLPLKILVGFLILLVFFPIFDQLMKDIYASMLDYLEQFFGLFAN